MARERGKRSEGASGAWAAFAAFLRGRGSRVTRSRRRVFGLAMARRDHFRADELAAVLRGGSAHVSRGTVYRTLALMAEAGLVSAVRDGDAHFHYERAHGRRRHHHMVCERCGRFVEFDDPAIRRAVERHCRRHRFHERRHRFVILGLCAACRRGR